ncbi:MAG: acyl-CoA dehydrogenase family protein [Candidatus Binatia bacterium]
MDLHPIVATARELQPLLRQHLIEGERRARLTAEVVTAVGQAGFFRVFAPKEVGGLEVSPPVLLALIEAVSAADPAVGWYIANSQPTCLTVAALAEKERAQLFAEPDRNFGYSGAQVGQAIPTDGGYRVSGQWPVVTGCEDAKWCALSGIVIEGAAPRLVNGYPDSRMFFIRTVDLEIVSTWQEAGAMRGTGSNQVRVHEVFVPEGLAYTPAKPLLIDRPAFRLPFALLFAPLGTMVIYGVFSTALESAVEALSTKVSTFSGQILREQASTQELIAHSSAAVRASRAGVLAAVEAVWEVARTGADVPAKLKADIYASCFYAADVARDTISRLYTQGTRAAFLQGNPVERALRNIHALVLGIQPIRVLYDAAGRVLLGGEPLIPGF